MSEPNLTNVVAGSRVGEGTNSFFKKVLGFFTGSNDPVGAAATAGVVDGFMKVGIIGTAEGAGAAAFFEKMGAPTWLAALGGIVMGSYAANNPIKGLFATIAVGIGVGLWEHLHVGDKIKKVTGLSFDSLIASFEH